MCYRMPTIEALPHILARLVQGSGTYRDVGDGDGVSDAEHGASVGGRLASDVSQQLLQLAGHQCLAFFHLLSSMAEVQFGLTFEVRFMLRLWLKR